MELPMMGEPVKELQHEVPKEVMQQLQLVELSQVKLPDQEMVQTEL